MNQSIRNCNDALCAVCLWCSVVVQATAAVFPLTDTSPDSPVFRKQFMASYGVNADIEPRLAAKDRPLYESIAPYLERNPRYAIQQVEAQITSESNAAFDFLLGNLYYAVQDFAVAERHLLNAIEKFPSFRRAYRTLALIDVQQEQFSASIPLWLKVISLGGGDAQSYGLLAYAYLNEDKYRSALSAYAMARMFAPESHDFKRGEAQCLLTTQNYDAAIALFDELIVDNPDMAEYWLLQANAYLAQENYDAAMANLEIAHEIESPSWQSLILLGDLYLNKDVHALATATYQQALKTHASIAVEQALVPLRSLLQRRHYAEAQAYLAIFDRVLEGKLESEQAIEHSIITAHIDLGLGNSSAAVARLEAILSKDPLNGHALLLLGNYEQQQGNLAAAELHLERASFLPDFQVEAWERLGQLAIKRRDFKQAIVFFEKVYALNPARHIKDYIEKLSDLGGGKFALP